MAYDEMAELIRAAIKKGKNPNEIATILRSKNYNKIIVVHNKQ